MYRKNKGGGVSINSSWGWKFKEDVLHFTLKPNHITTLKRKYITFFKENILVSEKNQDENNIDIKFYKNKKK